VAHGAAAPGRHPAGSLARRRYSARPLAGNSSACSIRQRTALAARATQLVEIPRPCLGCQLRRARGGVPGLVPLAHSGPLPSCGALGGSPETYQTAKAQVGGPPHLDLRPAGHAPTALQENTTGKQVSALDRCAGRSIRSVASVNRSGNHHWLPFPLVRAGEDAAQLARSMRPS
jgi:hypothetical protein